MFFYMITIEFHPIIEKSMCSKIPHRMNTLVYDLINMRSITYG